MDKDHKDDPDTGISYNSTTNAIQRLLNALKRRPKQRGMFPVLGLSSLLDNLIEFRAPQDEPPKIQSWNPVTRYKEHKALKKWVEERPPSAGITAAQLEKQYPRDLAYEHRAKVGLGAGAGVGLAGGAAAGYGFTKGLPKGERLLAGGIAGVLSAPYGAIIGTGVANLKPNIERAKKYGKALETVQQHFKSDKAVPLTSIKSPVPTARTYGEVTGELKKQEVGFLKRHITAAATRPIAWGKNAAFIPQGEKGLIVSPKEIHPAIFRHEAGHAKDYAHYGGAQGFAKAYPHYGDPLASRERKISSTLLPEHRAWAYAKPRNKQEKDIRDSALYTYRYAMGLSAKLDHLINFADDEKKRAKWGAVEGGLGGAGTGALVGGYAAALHPKVVNPLVEEMTQSSRKRMGELFEGLREETGESWRESPFSKTHEPFGTGRFTPEERSARIGHIKHQIAKKAAYRRIGKGALIGAATLGSIGALGGYARTRAGNSKEKKLSTLDDLIELAVIKPGMVGKSKLGLAVRKAKNTEPVWATGFTGQASPKMMALHRKLFNDLDSITGDPHITHNVLKIVHKHGLSIRNLSVKLDNLIQFQGDPRARNNLGEFSGNQEGGADPNAMFKTYRVAPTQPNMAPNKEFLPENAKQLAAVAALGGAAGTLGSETIKGGGKALGHLATKLRSRFRK